MSRPSDQRHSLTANIKIFYSQPEGEAEWFGRAKSYDLAIKRAGIDPRKVIWYEVNGLRKYPNGGAPE